MSGLLKEGEDSVQTPALPTTARIQGTGEGSSAQGANVKRADMPMDKGEGQRLACGTGVHFRASPSETTSSKFSSIIPWVQVSLSFSKETLFFLEVHNHTLKDHTDLP